SRLRNGPRRSASGSAGGARPRLRASRERPGRAGARAQACDRGCRYCRGSLPAPSQTMIVDSRREPAPRAVATLALALLLGLAASEARAGIAFVKNLGTATGSSNGGTSITITLAAGVSVAAGNSIIVSFVGEDLSGTYSATDSAGNSYSVN